MEKNSYIRPETEEIIIKYEENILSDPNNGEGEDIGGYIND